MTRYANRKSDEVESLVFVGSTPTLVTLIAWSNGYDAWPTSRREMVQLHPRSLDSDWSVSVSAARVRGKDEGRVQFPDGPFDKWAGMFHGGD